MINTHLKNQILDFLENNEHFWGQFVAIHEALSTNGFNFDRHFTSFTRVEFSLTRIDARFSGARIIFSGEKMYYEIGLDLLESFEKISENEFVFLEKYSETVFRKTRVRVQGINER
jgi:hypothetical protein